MSRIALLLLACLCLPLPSAIASGGGVPAGLPAAQALALLMEGNARYVHGKRVFPNQDWNRRQALLGGQKPFAIVVCCSDSRIPPEIVFDRGLGDLFIIRTAGQVCDGAALGSIEYAIEHLGAKLLFVLGHTKCGAVAATAAGGHAPGHVAGLVKAIKPAVDRARGKKGDLVTNAVVENVRLGAARLWASHPVIVKYTSRNQVKVVGGVYDLASGAVRILP